MNTVLKFRFFVLVIVLSLGSVSFANLVAEFLRPTPLLAISGIAKVPSQSQAASAKLASSIMPFRSDLRAEYAFALAGQTLNSSQATQFDAAQDAVKSSLRIGPHDSLMWLVLAILQTRISASDPHVAESLKMSYLTGQNRSDLIPTRLGSATSGNSLSDPDLAELARGDVRAILTRLPEQQQELVKNYTRASPTGKAFLEDSVRTIDPKFVDVLRK